MAFELTSERLQDIAVKCVSEFMSKQASLTSLIAKEAQDLELNSEQTKRVIEATNTIAYLRQLEKAADRTFEFDVADYNKVMAEMAVPEDMMKSADFKDGNDPKDKSKTEDRPKKDDDGDGDEAEEADRQKNDEGETYPREEAERRESEEGKQEKRAMLYKAYLSGKERLTKMAYDEHMLYLELESALSSVRSDPLALEKVALFLETEGASSGTFSVDKVAGMCGLEKRALEDRVFTSKELHPVEFLHGIYKKAEAFVKDKSELQDQLRRSEEILGLTKNAGFFGTVGKKFVTGTGDAAHEVGRGFGYATGQAARGLGNAALGTAKAVGRMGEAAFSKPINPTPTQAFKRATSRALGGIALTTALVGGNLSSETPNIREIL